MRKGRASRAIPAEALAEWMETFRRHCAERGLAVTHQRAVIYRALASSDEHPTPERVYEQVRAEVPSISLGTVYKSIRTFTEAGLLREVNPLHESLRLDADLSNHHHAICVRCHRIQDLPEEALEPVRWRQRPPAGFRPERTKVEVLGVCAACAGNQ